MDSLVTAITRSRWSHVALRFESDNVLAEALVGRGFILQPGGKYDGWNSRLGVPQLISGQAYNEMLYLSREWAEKRIPYGYQTCVAIGLKELFGLHAGSFALRWLLRPEDTLVCSEMMVKLFRSSSPDFLLGKEARLVTPDELYQALMKGQNEFAN